MNEHGSDTSGTEHDSSLHFADLRDDGGRPLQSSSEDLLTRGRTALRRRRTAQVVLAGAAALVLIGGGVAFAGTRGHIDAISTETAVTPPPSKARLEYTAQALQSSLFPAQADDLPPQLRDSVKSVRPNFDRGVVVIQRVPADGLEDRVQGVLERLKLTDVPVTYIDALPDEGMEALTKNVEEALDEVTAPGAASMVLGPYLTGTDSVGVVTDGDVAGLQSALRNRFGTRITVIAARDFKVAGTQYGPARYPRSVLRKVHDEVQQRLPEFQRKGITVRVDETFWDMVLIHTGSDAEADTVRTALKPYGDKVEVWGDGAEDPSWP